MSPQTFRLILLISCAHGLVHVFELSLPSVEQMIDDEFDIGRDRSGILGTAWRLPFGVGALFAGWLADRFGSKRMLLLYLGGCIATAWLSWWSPSLTILFIAMFAMGCFASIYHPVGLSLISRSTTPENRGMALGWHGILGSIGIAMAPFLAALVFRSDAMTWRQYYLALTIPAAAIGAALFFLMTDDDPTEGEPNLTQATDTTADDNSCWSAFFLLVTIGAMSGFIYGAFMHFLPRYLSTTGMRPSGISTESFRNYLAALVLLFSVAGQAIAGKIARPGRLEFLLSVIMFGSATALVWVAQAEGAARLWSTCTLALIFFMMQPVYNSLIAQYVPPARRSVGYGFSNMICFGIGALGPTYAGLMRNDQWTYGGLAVIAAIAGLVAIALMSPARRCTCSKVHY